VEIILFGQLVGNGLAHIEDKHFVDDALVVQGALEVYEHLGRYKDICESSKRMRGVE